MVAVVLVLLVLWWPGVSLAQFTSINEGEFTTHATNAPRFGTPIATGPDGAIYVCYVDTALATRIARKPVGGSFTSTVLAPVTQPDQYHNQCSVGIDKDGFLHVVANMHTTPWQYWRSNSANSIAAFTFLGQNAGTNPGTSFPAAGNCTGQCETDWLADEPGIAAIPGNQISYPTFANDHAGELYLGFRECLLCGIDYSERLWSAGLVKYNTTTQTWSRLGNIRPWATGITKLPIGLRLYGDRNNRLHASWIWCNHYSDAQGGQACFAQSNFVTYASSDDGGTTWRQANGTAMTLPLDYTETETVVPASWFDAAGAVGYFAGHTGLTAAGPLREPIIVVHPNAGNQPTLGIMRGYVRHTGTAWTYPPVDPGNSASLVYIDAAGVWTAVSSGMRIHRGGTNGASWTATLLDSARGAFEVAFDRPYLHATNHLRLYAHNATTGLLVIWTVQFPGTLARTYYVSPTGNDSYLGLTPSMAFATLQHAHDTASCGDTITVLPGTYYQRTTITKLCTAQAPLTIQGVRGTGGSWDTIVEGTDATSGWTSANAQCTGCYRIANPGYEPAALTALSSTAKLTVWKLHDNVMADNGFTELARSATSTCSRSVGTVGCWDGVEALFGISGGFTYLRFRNSEDPDTFDVRLAPGLAANSGTFTMDGATYITIQDLELAGGRFGVDVINGASNITIQRNYMRNGERGVMMQGGTGTRILNNRMDPRFIGSTAGYAATPYLPGDWGPQTVERRVANNIYTVNKFLVGDSTEDYNARIYLRGNSANTDIGYNEIFNVNAGIVIHESQGTLIHNNTLYNCAAECIWPNFMAGLDDSAYIYENTMYNGEHLVRIQQMETLKTLYFYRNLFYQAGEAAKHIHFNHTPSGAVTSGSVVWIYQNTFAGQGWAIDLGGDLSGPGVDDYKMPCVRILNNVVSVDGPDGTRGLSSAFSLHGRVGIISHNWVARVSGVPTAGTSGQNCTGATGTNTASLTAIWPSTPQPDFILPDGHAAVDTGLRLDQNFTLGGVVYPALPGMTAAYYGADGLPDKGALQGSETIPPPPPEPILTHTGCACYQVDLLESSAEGLRQIPCAVKPGGRIRLVCSVGLTGADVSGAFDFFMSDSGGALYKVTQTLGANRFAVGPDTQMGLPPVTPRLPLGGQTSDLCCRWRQGSDGAQACTLSAAGTGNALSAA